MSIEFQDAILAGVTLIREAIQSQNFAAGSAGWQIKSDGAAEFSDLTIRSSDGSSSTVTVANGKIQIRDGSSVLVIDISAGGYKLYDSLGDLVAQVTPETSTYGGGFWTRDFQFPNNIYAMLVGGLLQFGTVESGIVHSSGHMWWNYFPTDDFTTTIITTGRPASTDKGVWLAMESSSNANAVPHVLIADSTAVGPCDLQVTGDVSASNVRAGTAQTPAPGGVPAQTSVNVTFSTAMGGTPWVVATPNSASSNLNNSNIRWAVTSVSSTGFTLNCWRDTNAATNFEWHAIYE